MQGERQYAYESLMAAKVLEFGIPCSLAIPHRQ